MKVRFAWATRSQMIISEVNKKYGIDGMTINREVKKEFSEEELKELRSLEERKLIEIREVDAEVYVDAYASGRESVTKAVYDDEDNSFELY